MTEPIRVLLVDDQEPFRVAARAVVALAPEFVLVGEAESGMQAVEQAEALHPDLVLMDIHLPGIDGLEATRRIRAADTAKVVLLVSTYEASEQDALIESSGADAYIPKDMFGMAALRSAWSDANPGAGTGGGQRGREP